MRADVPVGAYVSGGLDSSITASLAATASPHTLRSFSIAFEDPRFDESVYQREVAAAIGSIHEVASIGSQSIAEIFPKVLWQCETPLLRTAPVPMYQLAKLTKQSGIKVVLTGEGADELFLGYDLFKEVSVRRFCLRRPESVYRQRLFDRLYPYLSVPNRGGEFWRRFFLEAGQPSDPLFSHLPRFLLSSRTKEFYTPEFRTGLGGIDVIAELRASLPTRFFAWSPLNRAAYLEMTTLLSTYLLSSQGDRMAMAHGVEGRFPFLDHRLFEFAAALPTGSRLRGLREKEVLRRWAARVLPPRIKARISRSRCAKLLHIRCARVDSGSPHRGRIEARRSVLAYGGRRSPPPLPLRTRDELQREPGDGRRPFNAVVAPPVHRERAPRRSVGGWQSIGSSRRQRANPYLNTNFPNPPMHRTEIIDADAPTIESDPAPGISEAAIVSRVRSFVHENFLYMMPDFELADDDRLLEKGVVDSMGIAEMISFIEAEFGVFATEAEISEANFGSLRAIARFVAAKQPYAVG